MPTRAQREDMARVQMIFLYHYCTIALSPLDRRRFEILKLLVGARWDMRVLCDESLKWIGTLYADPAMKPLIRF